MNYGFKIIFGCTILLGSFWLCQNVSAANWHILQGGAGLKNGEDWSHALATLPASLVRGDTYYIADGEYASYTFDDAIDGAKLITVKKATASDHGADSGWDNSYGDSQAVFIASGSTYQQGLNFKTGYYRLDGQVGSGSDRNAYGFKIIPADTTHSEQLIGLPNLGYSSYQVDHITISHVAMINSGIGDGTKTKTGIYSLVSDSSLASYDITIANNYFSGGHTNIGIVRGHHWIVKDNYFADNWSSANAHGQQITAGISDDLIFSGNIFVNTAVYAISAHRYGAVGKINYRWKIYNNIMIGKGESDETDLNMFVGNSTVSETDNVIQWQVHHNTMIDVDFTNASRGFIYPGVLSDVTDDKSYAYNNLFYNCVGPRSDNYGATAGGIVHDNNGYLACTGTINSADETASQRDDIAADPFINAVVGDYHPKIGTAPINNGKSDLGADYAYDFSGTLRGGSPDIGAYEYVGVSDATPPAAPTGLSVS